MKILMLNQFDIGSGTGTAASLLADGLQKAGVDVVFGVIDKRLTTSNAVKMSKKHIKLKRKIYHLIEKVIFKLFKTSNRIAHSMNLYSEFDIDAINNSGCDIVHLHWIGMNMIAIEDLPKIKKPIVWTAHDSWACCGAEHHPNILEGDKRYVNGYTKSNKPASSFGPDICRSVYKRKMKAYSRMHNICFIAPSKWEYDILRTSKLLASCHCETVHNIADKKTFCHVDDKIELRRQLGLPTDKDILMFGAGYDINDPKSLKGGKYLIDALKKFAGRDNCEIVLFGPANSEFADSLGLPVHNFGVITEPAKMAQLYNAADVFVCPSVIENLPYVCLESICCGTPVAAFRTGGVPEIVEHKYNGYLAEPFESDDLADGIDYVLSHRNELSANALKKAQVDFDNDETIRRHINIYKYILDNK